jgi:hypothetical protein
VTRPAAPSPSWRRPLASTWLVSSPAPHTADEKFPSPCGGGLGRGLTDKAADQVYRQPCAYERSSSATKARRRRARLVLRFLVQRSLPRSSAPGPLPGPDTSSPLHLSNPGFGQPGTGGAEREWCHSTELNPDPALAQSAPAVRTLSQMPVELIVGLMSTPPGLPGIRLSHFPTLARIPRLRAWETSVCRKSRCERPQSSIAW